MKKWLVPFSVVAYVSVVAGAEPEVEQEGPRPPVAFDGKRLVLAAEFLPADATCLELVEPDRRTPGVRTERGIEFPLRWGVPRRFTIAPTSGQDCVQAQRTQNQRCVLNAMRYLKVGDVFARFDPAIDDRRICTDYAIRRVSRTGTPPTP